jgi:hypothetical protein
VAGSILKIEDVNYTDKTRTVRRPLYAYVISAKRYALFTLTPNGRPVVVDDGYREHGLGHLLNPIDPESEDRDWMRQVWERIIREALGLPTEAPPWLGRPALTRTTVSTPRLLRRFDGLNRGKPYPDRVKPFNFALAAHVAPFGHPPGVDPARFQLVAEYTLDPEQWVALPWIDLYSGKSYTLRTADDPDAFVPSPGTIRAQTYRDVLARYPYHPEPKSLGPDGRPCEARTEGLLARRPVCGLSVTHIGKEANRLDDQEAGLVHDLDEVQAEYHLAAGTAGGETFLPLMRQIPATRLAALSGVSLRTIRRARTGRATPRRATREALEAAVARYVNDPPLGLHPLRPPRAARRPPVRLPPPLPVTCTPPAAAITAPPKGL